MKRITPQQAQDLMDSDNYMYLDVRSEQEFGQGHPAGAFNIPLNVQTAMGMQPNADFLAVVTANFPLDAKLVIGCRSGGRSVRAANLMIEAGYQNIVEQCAGWNGGMNPTTGQPETGWQPAGLPSAKQAEPGRDYASLKAQR